MANNADFKERKKSHRHVEMSSFSIKSKKLIERELLQLYSQMFSQLPIGWTLEQARKEVKKAIKAYEIQAKKERTDDLRKNFGNWILKAYELRIPNAMRIVEKARKEGANDEDIRKYWNLHDLQRRMVVWSENVFRYSTFLAAREEGLSPDEAIIKQRKMFPMYGNPEDTRHTSGDDRPLPHELRGRVDVYREKHEAEIIQKKVSKYSSYNAFIRAEIKKGNL